MLYSRGSLVINFPKAASVGAKMVNEPLVIKSSLIPDLSSRLAKVLAPREIRFCFRLAPGTRSTLSGRSAMTP